MLEAPSKENKEVIVMGDLNIDLLASSSPLSTWSLISEEFCLSQLI